MRLMLRKVVAPLAAAALLSPAALAMDSNRFELKSAADLVELCSVPADDPLGPNAVGFCHGYLSGAYQYYDATEPATNRFVCSPNPTPTRAKVMDGFVAWAKAHPQYMKERAADTLFRYLVEAYPCNK